MKTQSISRIALWVCVGVLAVVLGLFFFVGFDEPSADVAGKNDPMFTSLLMFTMYAFSIIATILTAINFALAMFKFRDTGLMRVFVACFASSALYVIFRLVFSGQVVPEGASYTSADMAVADAYIWTIAILFVIAVVVSVVCASGIMNVMKKK